MRCTIIRAASWAAMFVGLWLFAGGFYAANAAPSPGLTVATNPQAAAIMAGLAVMAAAWTGLFCRLTR